MYASTSVTVDYELLGPVGQGGEATVLKARSRADGAPVALKIRPHGAPSRDEAALLAALGPHPSLPVVLRRIEATEGTVTVFDWIEGPDLDDVLRREGAPGLDPGLVATWLDQVADALAHLHAHDPPVTHGDVKPANLVLGTDGRVHLVDFGAAAAGGGLGSRGFQAPEVSSGAPLGPTADVYGLATTALVLLTGRSATALLGEQAAGGDIDRGVVAHLAPALTVSPERRVDLATLQELLRTWAASAGDGLPGPDLAVSVELIEPEVLWRRHPDAMPAVLDRLEADLALVANTTGATLLRAPLRLVCRDTATQEATSACASATFTAAAWPGGVPARVRVEPAVAPIPDRTGAMTMAGREVEQAVLHGAIDQIATGGVGALVLIDGEPGIGKTTLVEHVTLHAHHHGVLVCWGRAYETGAPALRPWAELLHTLATTLTPGDGRDPLTTQDEEVLRQLVPAVAPDTGHHAVATLDSLSARERLFDAVTRLVRGVAAHRPLMLVIDDLHWADQTTVALLERLTEELAGDPVLLVATARNGEAPEFGPHSPSHQITLRGLVGQPFAEHVGAVLGTSPDGEVVEALQHRTGGNPFFAQAVIGLLVADGGLTVERLHEGDVPDTVRDVVRRRMARLSPESMGVLRMASVLGVSFDREVLGDILPSGTDLEAALAQAASHGAVERSRFTHTLVRDTLYDELATTDRAAVHRRVAGALLDRWTPEAPAADLAHHLCEAVPAGEVDTAVRFCRIAADQTRAGFAFAEAVEWVQRALDALDVAGHESPGLRADLLVELGRARQEAGDLEGGSDALLAAAAQARRIGDAERMAAAAVQSVESYMARMLREDTRVLDLIDETLALLGPEPTRTRALLLAHRASELALAWPPETPPDVLAQMRSDAGQSAIAAARALGDPGIIGRALLCKRACDLGYPDIEARARLAAEAREIGEKIRWPQLELEATVWHCADAQDLGNHEALRADAARVRRIAEQVGQPSEAWRAHMWDAWLAFSEDRIDDAEGAAHAALTSARRVHGGYVMGHFLGMVGLIHWARGTITDLAPVLDSASAQLPSIGVYQSATSFLLAEAGRDDQARPLYDALLADDTRDFNVGGGLVPTCSMLAYLSHHFGDAHRGRLLGERLAPFAGTFATAGGSLPLGPIDRYRALAALAADDRATAEQCFTDAIAAADRSGARFWSRRATKERDHLLASG